MNQLISQIDEVKVNGEQGIIQFIGYAFFTKIEVTYPNDIKKSLVLIKDNKKYYIPMENIKRIDVSDSFGEERYNYDYSGFIGTVDVSCIDNLSVPEIGSWKVGIYLNAKDKEREVLIQQINSSIHLTQETHSIYFPKEKRLIKMNNENGKLVMHSILAKSNPLHVEAFNYSKHHQFEHGIKHHFLDFILQSIYQIVKRCPVKTNRVTFLSDSRVEFSGNFEFIYNELLQRREYEIHSLLKPSISAKKTLKEKLKFLYFISTSKYLILDDYYPQIYKYKIKEDIEVIQLWHACGAFKTFGFSRMGKEGGPQSKSRNHKNYTKAIVSSQSIRKNYAEAFGISEDKVIATGVPRTDIFFDESYKQQKMMELYEKYPILKDKKVIMFAPTFRGNGQKTAHYDFDQLDLEFMSEQLSDEYVMIMKLHPFIKNIPTLDEKYHNFIIDLSHEREINDLLFISDILITDYSSVCFEYALLNRPMIFFAYDLEEYIATRDFYYPYESFVPGPIVKKSQEIVELIKNECYDLDRLHQFRTKFFDHLDGKSTQRVVDMLLKLENN